MLCHSNDDAKTQKAERKVHHSSVVQDLSFKCWSFMYMLTTINTISAEIIIVYVSKFVLNEKII